MADTAQGRRVPAKGGQRSRGVGKKTRQRNKAGDVRSALASRLSRHRLQILERFKLSERETRETREMCMGILSSELFEKDPTFYIRHHAVELPAPCLVLMENLLEEELPTYAPLYSGDTLSDDEMLGDMSEADWSRELIDFKSLWADCLERAVRRLDTSGGIKTPGTPLEREFMCKIWRDLQHAFEHRPVPAASDFFCGVLRFPRLLTVASSIQSRKHPTHGKCDITGEECRKNSLYQVTLFLRPSSGKEEAADDDDDDDDDGGEAAPGTTPRSFQVSGAWKEFIEACFLVLHFDEMAVKTVRRLLREHGLDRLVARKRHGPVAVMDALARSGPEYLEPLTGAYKWAVQKIYLFLHERFVPEDHTAWKMLRGNGPFYFRDLHKGWFYNTLVDVNGIEAARQGKMF